MRRTSQYRPSSGYRSSYYDNNSYSPNRATTSSQYNLRYNYDDDDDLNGYIGTQRFTSRSSRRQSHLMSSLIPNISLYEQNQPKISHDYAYMHKSKNEPLCSSGSLNGICSECGLYKHMVQCVSHCNLILCENCRDKHWYNEINELVQLKSHLEENVINIRKYLESKKKQCSENIKSCQQIKKFISMTMMQIKRKIELELESKRDELYDIIDSFVENQKKINHSINEEGLAATDRICQEIDTVILNTGDNMNFFKVKTVKGLANLQAQKLEKQVSKKIPFYSIIFVPDSSIQVLNSFGKIILKSYDDEDLENDSQDDFLINSYKNDVKQQKNKLVDKIKNERLQKWNSTECINFNNNNNNNNNNKFNLNNSHTELKNEKLNRKYIPEEKEEIEKVFDTEENPRILTLEKEIFLTDNNIENQYKPRYQSQPAPITRIKLNTLGNVNNELSGNSSGNSTDDYFNSFKPNKTNNDEDDNEEEDDEVINNNSQSDSDEDIISL